MKRASLAMTICVVLAACSGGSDVAEVSRAGLYPNETPELRRLIDRAAAEHDVPAALIHKVIQRESDYRPEARNGPYYGMMQILPATASTMGHRGPASELLDAEINLRYAVRYLRGAWLLSEGDHDTAVGWYARGYYYEARDRCMLRETGLLDREIPRRCR